MVGWLVFTMAWFLLSWSQHEKNENNLHAGAFVELRPVDYCFYSTDPSDKCLSLGKSGAVLINFWFVPLQTVVALLVLIEGGGGY